MTGEFLEKGGFMEYPEKAEFLRDSTMDCGNFALMNRSKRHGLRLGVQNQKVVDNEWVEILGAGAPILSSVLERTVTTHEDGPPMGKHELLIQLRSQWPRINWDERPYSVEAERVASDLMKYEARFFRSPQDELTLVQDFVILHILDPDGDRALVELTASRGYPQMIRKTHEPLTATVKRIINEMLPEFFHGQFRIEKFDVADGVWIVPV